MDKPAQMDCDRARRLERAAGCGLGNCTNGSSAAKPPDGAALFKQQCALPHHQPRGRAAPGSAAGEASSARQAGTFEGFHYSPGFATADFARDDGEARCLVDQSAGGDPGAIMAYRQAKPEVRAAIITLPEGAELMGKPVHSMIRVLDEAKALDFYARAFGLQIAERIAFPDFALVYLRHCQSSPFELELTVNFDRQGAVYAR